MAITIADIEQLTSEHRTLADGAPIDAEVSALIRNLFLHPLIDLRVRSKGDMDIILAILATAPKLSYPRYFSPDREKCRRTLINGYSLPGDLYAHPPSVLLGRYSLSQACICRLLPAASWLPCQPGRQLPDQAFAGNRARLFGVPRSVPDPYVS